MNIIVKTGGILLLLTGLLILTNQLQPLGFYLLRYMPFLQNLGQVIKIYQIDSSARKVGSTSRQLSKKLLNKYNIHTKLISNHKFNEKKKFTKN